MKKIFIFILLSAFSLNAGEGKVKSYLSLKTGPSWPHLARMKILNSTFPEKIAKKSDTDLNLLYALSVGFSYEEKKLPFYFEVEYIGHSNATFFVKTISPSAFYINKFQIENQGLFGNAFYKIKVHERFSPYLNIGFGFSYNKTKVSKKIFSEEEEFHFAGSKEYKFSWNMGAGISSRLYKSLFAEVGYRYSDLNKICSGKLSDQKEKITARLIRNEVIATLRLEF